MMPAHFNSDLDLAAFLRKLQLSSKAETPAAREMAGALFHLIMSRSRVSQIVAALPAKR